MWQHLPLVRQLGLRVPILSAPMAGAATPELAAAISRSGGLGGLGCGASGEVGMTESVRAARDLGAERINVNFFLHKRPHRSRDREAAAVAALAPLSASLGVDPPARIDEPFAPFDRDLLEAVVRAAPNVVTFHFDAPDQETVRELHEAGIAVGATATTVAEAILVQQSGCDFVIAQGSEAGGHRGTFAPPFEPASIGTMALVPQVVDAVSLPVVAAGGIADGRGVAAALMLGASAVQLGTAFLGCPETSTSAAHRCALETRAAEDTVITTSISGRPARAFRNALTRESNADHVAEFPLQFPITQVIRSASSVEHETEAMWAGQAFPLQIAEPASEVMARVSADAQRLFAAASY